MLAAVVVLMAGGRQYFMAEGRRVQAEVVQGMLDMGLADRLAELEAAPANARPRLLETLPPRLRSAQLLRIEALPDSISRIDVEERPIWVDQGTVWAKIDDHQVLRFGALKPPQPNVFLFLFIALVVAIASVGTALPLVRRLRHLTAASQEVAAGNLGVRVKDGGRDAIGALARQFDTMTAALQRQSQEQQAFLHGMTHELATPLARLEFAMELLEQAEEEERAPRLQAVRREVGELNQLADEILEWSGESSEAPLCPEPVDLAAMIRDVVERRPTELEIRIEAPKSLEISGDFRSIERAFDNVLRNAQRYATQHIDIRLGSTPVEVWFEDDGPGIPEALRERVFEPFVRADASRDRRTGGAGLGLSIVARTMERHGGSAEACHSAKLGGAAICLRWPAST